MYRTQIEQILYDLNKKMVFIVGPRQVGKTWLALETAKQFHSTTYLNCDNIEDLQIIKKRSWSRDTELLIFDELHKFKDWKNYLKGIFDTKPGKLKIIVTGSARLELLKQRGDSLAGRYFKHRLMPFSMAELKNASPDFEIDRYIDRGGFPEPFLAKSETEAKRWRNLYIDDIIRYDLAESFQLHDIRSIRMVFELLRRKVGSPISYKSIAEDVQISPTTVKHYIQVLESLYIIFSVAPFSKNIARSILKEPKIYFYDTGLVIGDEGSKLENFVAISLLKHCYGLVDSEGETMNLNYLRTKDKKEVDFCITDQDAVKKLIEVKTNDVDLSRNLEYFCNKYGMEGVQIVKKIDKERSYNNIDIRRAGDYMKTLYL